MSKSKGNGVSPEDVIAQYGVDIARMFILFKAPPEKDLEWDEADVEGQARFLGRVWRLVTQFIESGNPSAAIPDHISAAEKKVRRATHIAIKEITEDLEGDYQFNTAVSELMKLSNALGETDCPDSPAYAEGVNTLIRLLAPFAPHLAEELWSLMGHSGSIHTQAWCQFEPRLLVADEITIAIQVMGKLRGTIEVPTGISKEDLEALALASETAQKYVVGKEIKKTIVVPGKLVNFVVV
jgi:leucyl-tRNA synthetase